MRKIAVIMLFFFSLSAFLPASGWATQKKKKKLPPKVVVEKPKETYLPFEKIEGMYPPPSLEEGEGLFILREDVKVILHDGSTGKISEGWIPSGTTVIVKKEVVSQADGKEYSEERIVKIYVKKGHVIPVLNRIILKDLQQSPKQIQGEELRIILLDNKGKEKKQDSLFPQKDPQPSLAQTQKTQQSTIDLGLGPGSEKKPEEKEKKKKRKWYWIVGTIILAGIVVYATSHKKDDPGPSGGGGGGGHPAPP